MASQKEHLMGGLVDDLRNFAGQHGVDLEGATTKEEIADKIAAVQTPSADEVKAAFPLDEEPKPETQPEASPEATPASEVVQPTRTVQGPEAILDPALTDPQGVALARVEGRTSDPANRVEGVTVGDVPPDINQGPKQSDAGPEAYPFPPGGDVDVALVDPGTSSEEYPAPLNVDDWVVLDGKHPLVPDRLDGHIAYVTSAPNQVAPDVHDHPNAARTPVPDAGITVKTRDEVNATLVLPMDAFKAVGRGGRTAVLPIG